MLVFFDQVVELLLESEIQSRWWTIPNHLSNKLPLKFHLLVSLLYLFGWSVKHWIATESTSNYVSPVVRPRNVKRYFKNNLHYLILFPELLPVQFLPSNGAATKESFLFLSQAVTEALLHLIDMPQSSRKRHLSRLRSVSELRNLVSLSQMNPLRIHLRSAYRNIFPLSVNNATRFPWWVFVLALGGFCFIVGIYCFKAGITILPSVSDEVDFVDQTPMETTEIGESIKSKLVDLFNQVEYDTRTAVCDFTNIVTG